MSETQAERRLVRRPRSRCRGLLAGSGADEERILANSEPFGGTLIDPIIAVTTGCIVKRKGDGGIVEFWTQLAAPN